MPFALHNFSPEEFNIWMLFVAFFGLIVVFDFGLTPALSRQYNYILAGAQTIEKEGISDRVGKDVNKKLFSELYYSSRMVFNTITLLAAGILLFSYISYLSEIAAKSNMNIALEWLLYSLSILISLICLNYNALFFGTNNINSIYRTCSISNIAFFIIAIYLIIEDCGLLAIAVARLTSAAAYFIQARIEIYKNKIFNNLIALENNSHLEILRKILPNASKIGGVSLGNFLSTKISILLVANYLPPNISGSYSLALNIFSVIISLSLLYMSIKTPELNKLYQLKDIKSAIKLQNNIYFYSIGLFIFGSLAFVALAPYLLKLINSKIELPANTILFIFIINSLFECIRTISMNFISCSNYIPFLKTTIITGILITLSTLTMFQLDYLSIFTPLLCILIANSIYNNWIWVYCEHKERHKSL